MKEGGIEVVLNAIKENESFIEFVALIIIDILQARISAYSPVISLWLVFARQRV